MKTQKFQVPEWAYEFHGHQCPFMPIGYRMGTVAMEKLGIERCKDHEMHVLSEMGVGHPQGCMQDGIMSATSATFGKGMMEKLHYGKVAATFCYPNKGAVRIVLNNNFQDKLAPHEFFTYRKKGIEPSQIPAEVRQNIINMVLNAPIDELFTIEMLPDFVYKPMKGSFAKAKCEVCGEYTFERYLRVKDGKKTCIPCSNQEPSEHVFYHPIAKNK
ncbi:FmdE family protein [Ancylomarina longa]|uniref:Formylmethanofuran dehydrogenase n=1 Tax=Ancylomarina longa TaxID=2487017 RepID=A0A434AFJ7_9BACT|nr:FmdE family protein [Ancylomarina longa]RUT73122.1 formylmethanofuran dehydrogenase [Ancylomarina longa]